MSTQQHEGVHVRVIRSEEPRKPSPRQLQVLALIADGRTNRQAAVALGLSPYTVKEHMSQVLEGLGVTSRAHAVAICMRQGWLA